MYFSYTTLKVILELTQIDTDIRDYFGRTIQINNSRLLTKSELKRTSVCNLEGTENEKAVIAANSHYVLLKHFLYWSILNIPLGYVIVSCSKIILKLQREGFRGL